ncbi:peptidase [Escherichia albertii]|nr:peptidase [Escherichia albertii]
MNLFERLVYRRLCNEQPADGGTPAAASADTAATGGSPTPAAELVVTETDASKKDVVDAKSSDGDKPDADGKKPDTNKDDKTQGAPEKYEFQAAEGSEIDAAALADFEPVARDLNLTQEQAQKLVDVYPKILAGVRQRQTEAWQQQTETWAQEVKADKEIGGDKLVPNLSAAQRAVDTFGTKELKTYLEGTGLGNHPELVKFCVKVGKAMAEDSMVQPGNGGQLSAAEVLYGKK